jgi:hypothetical protein
VELGDISCSHEKITQDTLTYFGVASQVLSLSH